MIRFARVWWPTVLFALMVPAAYALSPDSVPVLETLVNLVVYSAFSLTGGWIVSRSPNRMGRLFQALALCSVALFLTDSYLAATVSEGGEALAQDRVQLAVLMMNLLLFMPFFLLSFVLPFVLFPTGRPASRRWSYVLWGTLVWAIVLTIAQLVVPVLDVNDDLGKDVPNPLAVDPLSGATNLLLESTFAVISVLGFLAVASLVFRYRAAGAEQRAQIRWFLLAGVFLIMGLVLDEVVLDALAIDVPALESGLELVVMLVGLLGLPVATTVAILKYRLYDVDVVINKTLVYGSLTVVLAAVYGGVVIGLQRLLPASATDSELAVAAATLAVAAAFRPLRSRLQELIDRSFYRRRYDAASTLGEFASHLRDQVDLESLNRELVRVVAGTMQPAHASLWLRSEASS